jgi:PAS domain S-box-containing protein
MIDETRFLAQERCELITRRLGPFAIGWIGALGIWLLVFAVEGRLTPWAVLVAVVQAAILGAALTICRAAPAAPRVVFVVVAASVLLGLASIVLTHAVGAYGEILAFMLLTLYLASALVFSWGWRAELVVLLLTLVPWGLQLWRFAFFVPRGELAAAVAIGASLAVTIAEGYARNFRTVLRRRRAQEQTAAELQVSRDAYRDLAENARDMIWVCDREARFTYVNESLSRFLGRAPAELQGRSIPDFVTNHPLNPDLRAALARAAAWETLPPQLIEITTPAGPRWIEAVGSTVRDVDGLMIGMRGISRDVTERRASEDALRASEARYRGLVESANELVTRFDRGGNLTFANDAYCRAIGYPRESIVGRNPMFLVHPDDRDAVIASFRAALQPPYRSRLESRGCTSAGWCWFDWELSGVRDESDRVVEIQQVGRDVTARRQAEADLRESEERFRSAFDDAAIGMAVTAVDGRTLRVNPALCEMLGYSEPELLACMPDKIVHPDDWQRVEADRARLADRMAQYYRAERRYCRSDGRLVWVHVTASMVRDANGAPLYFIGQIQDITERHLAEEALQGSLAELRRSEEKLRLLAQRQVAIREEERKRLGFDLHDDVCQELVGIGILVESLHRNLAPMPVEQSAEFDRVVGYLGEVVEHLRLLARELRPLLLHDLGLDGSLRSLADGMASATLRIVTEFAAAIPRLEEDAEVSVYRIAQEALANAVRHAGAGRIVIALDASRGELMLEVRDDGCGFDPATRPAVALGLASMEERALALGGRLEIRSTPGKGTTVVLACPLDLRVPDRFREPAAPSPTRSSSLLSAATTPRSVARD